MLRHKKIILAITGSIAAYKTPELTRQLIKAGAEVKVVMTESARDFVAPLSLATVSKNEVLSLVSNGEQWNNHVEMGIWADYILIAPCSANTLSKMANGICDNLVQAIYLSARCPVLVAPAMDEDMWRHPSVQYNINRIQTFGNIVIAPEYGELASGLIAQGRMAEPQNIVQCIIEIQNSKKVLKGKKAIVTAGPTYEMIDPVRYIGNFSTGKMGIALAEALAEKGAMVDLILGPTGEKTLVNNIKTVHVISANEMYHAAVQSFSDADIAIMAAAVADFTPDNISETKIKKGKEQTMQLQLVKTKDILASIGQQKKANQLVVGFALETNDELENARKKMKNKNADYIVLNSLNDKGAGFGHATNKVTILSKHTDSIIELPLQSKKEIADRIIDLLLLHNL